VDETTQVLAESHRNLDQLRRSRQIVYSITSILPETMDAEALLNLARTHWQIEDRLVIVRSTYPPALCQRRKTQDPQFLICVEDDSLFFGHPVPFADAAGKRYRPTFVAGAKDRSIAGASVRREDPRLQILSKAPNLVTSQQNSC
jgi:hypothetical protein